MPETEHLHRLPDFVRAIDDEIRTEGEKARAWPLRQRHSDVRGVCQRLRLRDQSEPEALGGRRIILRNEFHNPAQIVSAANRENYRPAHARSDPRSSSADRHCPPSISRSASSSEARSSARSTSVSASNPNRRASQRASKASRSCAGRASMAISISATLLMTGRYRRSAPLAILRVGVVGLPSQMPSSKRSHLPPQFNRLAHRCHASTSTTPSPSCRKSASA